MHQLGVCLVGPPQHLESFFFVFQLPRISECCFSGRAVMIIIAYLVIRHLFTNTGLSMAYPCFMLQLYQQLTKAQYPLSADQPPTFTKQWSFPIPVISSVPH